MTHSSNKAAPQGAATELTNSISEQLARRAVDDLQPSGAGELIGVITEDVDAVTYRFTSDIAGYQGWEWQVVIAGTASHPTVSEMALIPGPDALVAPEWVPWVDRVEPGDLSDRDVLPVSDDDPRLVPGYMDSGDSELDDAALPIGYGRERVLSQYGRQETAQRWYTGEYGPQSNRAKKAPAQCATCGFYVPLAGALKASFGVCANRLSADGHVVHSGYGCGAHSSVREDYSAARIADMYYDDSQWESIS